MSLSDLLARARPLVAERISLSEPCILFFSLCNGKERASIHRSSGKDFHQAWKEGVALCQRQAERQKLTVRWLRIDWVLEVETTTWERLLARLNNTKRNYFRLGLSLDAKLETAFLEQEINANAMLYPGADNPAAGLNLKNFSVRAKRRFGPDVDLDFSPERDVYLFTHEGVFLAQDDGLAHLPEGSGPVWLPRPGKTTVRWREAESLNCGRRQITSLEPEQVYALIESSSNFLAKQVEGNGRFIYGHFPCFGRQIPTYNALRHASSVYSMLEGWELTQDKTLLAAIRRALTYLTDTLIRLYPQADGTNLAFNVDVGGEIKLGANAVSILALVKYDQLTGDTQYRPLMEALALGIARMQDPNSGGFVHVLNAEDLSVKEAFRIVYYDGEAAFGLMRLYGLTKDPRWLNIVERAFDYFIQSEHWKHHDHWLSYCANELTLHRPEEKYFQFGVQNIAGYLDFILTRETTYPTLLELSMAFEAMLQRINTAHPEMKHVLEGLDIEKFHRALHHRAHYLLNGFFWPELAMYFAKPETVVGSFFIRHHSFRVRIDDIEHYLSGYVAYWKLLSGGAYITSGLSGSSVETAPVLTSHQQRNWNAENLLQATRGSWRVAPQNSDWSADGLTIWRPAMEEGHIVALRAEGWKGGVPPAAITTLPHRPRALLLHRGESTPVNVNPGIPLLEVDDMRRAVFGMGHFARRHMAGKIIGVTGSAGKTTMVAILRHTLQHWGKVGSTKHNSNLPIGIAWNLASIPWDSAYAVLEMAIGGMNQNTALVKPHIAVFSNIAPAHLEYHTSTAEIARKKSRIFAGMDAGSTAVLNRDMEHWEYIAAEARARGLHVLNYGQHVESHFRLRDYHSATRTAYVETPQGKLSYCIGAAGLHMAYNTLACLAVIAALDLSTLTAASRFESFVPLDGRGKLLEIKREAGIVTIIDEAYNANPASMAAALGSMSGHTPPRECGRRVVILGDMLELGKSSIEFHQALDLPVLSTQPALVLLCGEEMRALYHRLIDRCPVHWFKNVETLISKADDLLQDGDLVLIKSSAGIGLNKLVEALKRGSWRGVLG